MDRLTVSSIMKGIGDLLPNHTSIAISDESEFIYYQPSKSIDLKIQPGDKISEGTVTYMALSLRHKVSQHIDSHLFGISYFGISVPILESGFTKGCITAIFPSKPSQLVSTLLTIKTNDRWIPVPFEQIMYLEAQNRKTRIQTITRGEGFHKCNLSELEMILPESLFIRVHRSYIVNVNSIHEIHPDSHSTFLLIMKDKTKIPVSQSYASFFRKTLGF